MSWNHRIPVPGDYENPEDYEQALDAYYDAEDRYIEEYAERHRG